MTIENSLNIIFPNQKVEEVLFNMAREVIQSKGLLLSETFKEGDAIVHCSAYKMLGNKFPTMQATAEDVKEFSGKNGFYIINPS